MSIATFTVESFEKMIHAGVFDHLDDTTRVELLNGEITYKTPPPIPEHDDIIDRLTRWSVLSTSPDRVRVRIQNAVDLEQSDSVPLPDVTWVEEADYSEARPDSSRVLLVIEVAHSSLTKDREEKARSYAKAGIQDYWIVNLRDRVVEVHRKPMGDAYGEKFTAVKGESVTPLLVPDATLEVASLWRGA